MSDLRELADALWPQARRRAQRRCRDTLYRLRRGDGGFYDDQDFMQDLFLEFWRILPDYADEDALWRAWDRALYRGGVRILRRAPQRLWRGRPLVIDADDPVNTVTPEDAQEWNLRMERLEEALWRLPLVQRQLLYMCAVQGQRAAQVALELGFSDDRVVRRRLSDARANLGREYRREVAHEKA